MSKFLSRARIAAIAVTAAAILSVAGAANAKPPAMSPAVQKLLVEAQKAIKTNDVATIKAKANEAKALPDLKPGDIYMINYFLGYAAITEKDFKAATVNYEAMADSGVVPSEERVQVFGNALQLALAASHFDKAITYGEELNKTGDLDAAGLGRLAVAYYQAKQIPKAKEIAQKSIDMSNKAGQPHDANATQVMSAGNYANMSQAELRKALEDAVVVTNSPTQWSNLIENSMGTKGMGEPELLYLLRLRVLTNSLLDNSDYKIMADTALRLGNSAEALKVLESGMSQGKVTAGALGATLSRARTDAAKDRASINGFVAAAAKSPNGELDYKASEALFGYARYADSEAAAARALTKSGVKDRNRAQLSLGMALAAQNKNAEAQAAFAAVGGTPAQKRTAELWTIYTKRQTNQ